MSCDLAGFKGLTTNNFKHLAVGIEPAIASGVGRKPLDASFARDPRHYRLHFSGVSMDDLKQHIKRLDFKPQGATNQCIMAARRRGSWDNSGNGGAKRLPRIDDAKGQELVMLLAVMYQNGKMTEAEAAAMLSKHGF